MTIKKPKVVREPRADAARNYQALLSVARQAFNEKGSGVRLEEIARAAGLGIGTLYRHFPTREALIQEVYRGEIERLAALASELSERHSPAEALRQWLHIFVDHLATERLLSETLHVRPDDTALIAQTSGALIAEAVTSLVRRALPSCKSAPPLDPSDLLRALVGIATIYPDPQWETNAKRLANVMVAGMVLAPQNPGLSPAPDNGSA